MLESLRDEIAKLEALHEAQPEGRIFTHLAEAYRRAGELTRARRLLESGLEKHAEYSSAHVVLGRVLRDTGELVGATQAFRRVIELDPENTMALRALADLAREMGDAAEAVARYRALLELEPEEDDIAALIAELEAGGTASAAARAAAETDSPAVAEDEAEAPDTAHAVLDGMSGDGEVGAAAEAAYTEYADEAESAGQTAVEDEGVAAGDESRGWSWLGQGGTSWVGSGSDDDDADAPLVTETMADLYAGQGLHDRAAEVYRRLLAQRPGDARLMAKLAESERALGRPTPELAAPAPDVEPSEDAVSAASFEHDGAVSAEAPAETPAAEAADWGWDAPAEAEEEDSIAPWAKRLEEIESAWSGGGAAAGATWQEAPAREPEASPEPEPATADAGSVSIGAYLRSLVAWRPAGAGGPGAAGADVSEEPGESGAQERGSETIDLAAWAASLEVEVGTHVAWPGDARVEPDSSAADLEELESAEPEVEAEAWGGREFEPEGAPAAEFEPEATGLEAPWAEPAAEAAAADEAPWASAAGTDFEEAAAEGSSTSFDDAEPWAAGAGEISDGFPGDESEAEDPWLAADAADVPGASWTPLEDGSSLDDEPWAPVSSVEEATLEAEPAPGDLDEPWATAAADSDEPWTDTVPSVVDSEEGEPTDVAAEKPVAGLGVDVDAGAPPAAGEGAEDIEEQFERLFSQNIAPSESDEAGVVAEAEADADDAQAQHETRPDDDDDDLEMFRSWLQSLKR